MKKSSFAVLPTLPKNYDNKEILCVIMERKSIGISMIA